MRRRAARPLASALERVLEEAAPATLLGRVQRRWGDAAGARVAAVSEPRSERGGVVTVACESAVWAEELTLLGAELLESLNASLGAVDGAPAVRSLRFVTGAREGAGPRPLPNRR